MRGVFVHPAVQMRYLILFGLGGHVVRSRIVMLMIATSVAGLTGCGEDAPPERPPAATAPADAPVSESAATTPAAAVSMTVSADKTHAVQPGDEITVTVALTGFTLDAAKIGASDESGIGHYRVYLDGATGEDFLAESGTPVTRVVIPQDVTDGSHELRAVLYRNSRAPLEPPVEASVTLIIYRL